MRAPALLLQRDRAREARRIPQRHLLGETCSGIRRSQRPCADTRPGACRSRGESYGPRVHRRRRRRLWRFPDDGHASEWLCEHSHLSVDSTTASTLTDAYIAAAVRCAPPDNKPTPEEIHACRPHLHAELECLPNVKVVVALGKIAFDVWWRVMQEKGIADETTTRVRSRCGLQGSGLASRDRVLSSKPAEHEHRKAHCSDDVWCVQQDREATPP